MGATTLSRKLADTIAAVSGSNCIFRKVQPARTETTYRCSARVDSLELRCRNHCCRCWHDTQHDCINLITEFFTSGNLREYRQKHRHLELKAVRKWARQILSGLDYLHLKDPPVIHGDLRCDKVCPTGSQDILGKPSDLASRAGVCGPGLEGPVCLGAWNRLPGTPLAYRTMLLCRSTSMVTAARSKLETWAWHPCCPSASRKA